MLEKKYRIGKNDIGNPAIKKVHKPFLTLIVSKNSYTYPRFAVIVSKKTAKTAVVRNTIKRQIFACLDMYMTASNPYDIKFVIKPAFLTLSPDTICATITATLKEIL